MTVSSVAAVEAVKIIVEDRVAVTGWLPVKCWKADADATAMSIAHGMSLQVISGRSRECLKMAYRRALNRVHNSGWRLDVEVADPEVLPPETPV